MSSSCGRKSFYQPIYWNVWKQYTVVTISGAVQHWEKSEGKKHDMSFSVDVELIAVTSQITKQAFCAKMFSAGVYIPVTAHSLSLLPSPPPFPPSPYSLLLHWLTPSHLSGVMEWLSCATPKFLSPATLHVYPNIHCVCQTGRFLLCLSLCPCLPIDTSTYTQKQCQKESHSDHPSVLSHTFCFNIWTVWKCTHILFFLQCRHTHTNCMHNISLCTIHAHNPTHTVYSYTHALTQRLTTVKWSCQLAGASPTNKHPIYLSLHFCFRPGCVCVCVHLGVFVSLCVKLNSWACGYQQLWSPNSTRAPGWQAYPPPPACSGRPIKRKANRQ